jgi:D-tagatose 6-phosphate 4-epimerase
MTSRRIAEIARDRQNGSIAGIASICTAHPMVIEATLLHGRTNGAEVLIEATCNQVNQDGGYTGMTPSDFRRFVEDIADRVGFDRQRLILGGDHLGPNPWKHLPSEAAMGRAEAMIEAYARAGFTKLHLDTSMGCAGESIALPDDVTARRAARLAVAAEASAYSAHPSYIIGTEVPVPGGALESIKHLAITSPEAALQTVEVHRAAFAAAGADAAFERVVGIVVQPGVEFGNANVIAYRRDKARDLSAALSHMPQFVFEAHSTDYQSVEVLHAMVEDGFAILKVGPWLTFALRETLYGLDHIAQILDPDFSGQGLKAAMERLMVEEPANWEKYYHDDVTWRRIQRHFSYSDRIRYYWPHPEAVQAVSRLLSFFDGRRIPETLVSQYLAAAYPAVAQGHFKPEARQLLLASVQRVLDIYSRACGSLAHMH